MVDKAFVVDVDDLHELCRELKRFRLRLRTLNALLALLGNVAAIESKLLLQGHTLPCGVIDAGWELLPAASAL
jgi:hypothetical protein